LYADLEDNSKELHRSLQNIAVIFMVLSSGGNDLAVNMANKTLEYATVTSTDPLIREVGTWNLLLLANWMGPICTGNPAVHDDWALGSLV